MKWSKLVKAYSRIQSMVVVAGVALLATACGAPLDRPPIPVYNAPNAIRQAPPPTQQPSGEARSHIVSPGDTIYSLANRYRVQQDELMRLNGISDPTTLSIGTVLIIPEPIRPRQQPITGSPSFQWPLRGAITQRFGVHGRGIQSDGINIAARFDTPVLAAFGGEVAFIGTNLRTFGNMLLIKHDSGWVTAYAHLGSITVRDRQRVARGQQVGLVGQSGRVDAPQLHFQIRHFRQPVNPLDYLPR